jgi:hypothetical protein
MAKRTSAAQPARHPRSHPVKSPRKADPPAGRPFAPDYGIVGPDEGVGLLPWTWVARKMNRCHTFWVATIRPSAPDAASPHLAASSTPDVRPHVMPVWGVWVDDAFFLSTGRKSRKGQNLASNPACTVANDDGEEAVIIEGEARELIDAPVLERVAAVYKKKYKMDPRSINEPIFKLAPRKVFAFIEKSFPKSATRWKC